MLEALTAFFFIGLVGLGLLGVFLGLALMLKLVAAVLGGLFWLITLPIRAVLWLLVLPFKILGGILTLAAGVLLLPVLAVGVLGAVGLVGAFALVPGLLLVAFLVLLVALPVVALVWLLRDRPTSDAKTS